MFCKHKWKVVDKTMLPSAVEQEASYNRQLPVVTMECYRKTVMLIVACELCGKLRKFTETNP